MEPINIRASDWKKWDVNNDKAISAKELKNGLTKIDLSKYTDKELDSLVLMLTNMLKGGDKDLRVSVDGSGKITFSMGDSDSVQIGVHGSGAGDKVESPVYSPATVKDYKKMVDVGCQIDPAYPEVDGSVYKFSIGISGGIGDDSMYVADTDKEIKAALNPEGGLSLRAVYKFLKEISENKDPKILSSEAKAIAEKYTQAAVEFKALLIGQGVSAISIGDTTFSFDDTFDASKFQKALIEEHIKKVEDTLKTEHGGLSGISDAFNSAFQIVFKPGVDFTVKLEKTGGDFTFGPGNYFGSKYSCLFRDPAKGAKEGGSIGSNTSATLENTYIINRDLLGKLFPDMPDSIIDQVASSLDGQRLQYISFSIDGGKPSITLDVFPNIHTEGADGARYKTYVLSGPDIEKYLSTHRPPMLSTDDGSRKLLSPLPDSIFVSGFSKSSAEDSAIARVIYTNISGLMRSFDELTGTARTMAIMTDPIMKDSIATLKFYINTYPAELDVVMVQLRQASSVPGSASSFGYGKINEAFDELLRPKK